MPKEVKLSQHKEEAFNQQDYWTSATIEHRAGLQGEPMQEPLVCDKTK
jgi:hypothetical protein